MKNPWGEVTGIRPVKIARTMLRSGKTKDEFVEMFKNHKNPCQNLSFVILYN